MSPDRRSPLHDAHVELGAKLVPFGGWTMPLNYERGTVTEHLACRDDAVVFDVSHLGTLEVSGPGAYDALQWAFTNDLGRIGPGRAQYTHLLDAADGSVLDDIIVWWVDEERFEVMPNASNTDRVRAALREIEESPAAVDITSTRALLAVQGPAARERLASVAPPAAAVGRFRVARCPLGATSALVAGTGYTGEDGVELSVPAADAAEVWNLLIEAGIQPAGLGARDTLRLEAGLPLHGSELGPGITSAQAGLSWVVRLDKGSFRGRPAVISEASGSLPRRLHGLVAEGRRPLRAGQTVRIDGIDVGRISSGNFSPVRQQGIALAFLDRVCTPGTAVTVDVRGSEVAAVVHDPPFFPA